MQQLRTLTIALIVLFGSIKVFAQTASSNFVFSNIQTTQFTVSWTNGSGTGRLVTVRASPNGVVYPIDFTNYSTSTTFGNGYNLGSGNYCVYKGAASSLTIYGLTAGTYYTVSVFEYTGTSTSPNFTTSPYGAAGHYSLVAQPTTQASAMTVSNITSSGATIGWTQGSGSRELVTLKYSTTNTNVPTDGTDYAASTTFGGGDPVGTSPYAYAVYDGSSNSVVTTGMATSSNFVAAAYNFDGVSGQNNYITTSAPTVGFTTLASEPTGVVSYLAVTDQEDDMMTLSWTLPASGAGTNRIILINSTSAFDVPLDATIYTANANYGSGSLIGQSYVVYNGSGTNGVRVTNLNLETSYTIRVFEYNGGSGTFNPTTNYLTNSYGYTVGSTNTTHPGVGSSNMTFSAITPTSVTVNFTAGAGQARLVQCKAGRRQTAAAFDGANDHIVVPFNSELHPTSDLTLEAWVYRPNWSSSTGSQVIAGSGESGGYYMMQSGTTMYSYVYRNSTWGGNGVTVSHLTPGWHHFAMTYDGRYLRSYVDGAQYGLNDAGATYPIGYTWANAFIIGADVGTGSTASGSYFNGMIDEVRVWNVSQYQGNIQYYKDMSLYGYESGLVGYWKLDDGTATTSTALNSSVTLSNLNGTLTTMATTAASAFTASSGWVNSNSPVNQPVDFSSYTSTSSIFMNGQQVGNPYYGVMYTTSGNSVNVTGLSPGTYYNFIVTEMDYSVPFYNYHTPGLLSGEVQTTAGTVPAITNMSPVSGAAGTVVTLTGTGFSTTPTNNVVLFGPTRASVSSATATSLSVVVPYGANNTPVSVSVNGLTGTYTREFNVTSSCSNPINTNSFTNSTNATSNLTYGNTIRDYNSDGKPDVLVCSYGTTAVNGYLGQSTNGVTPPVFSASTFGVPSNPYYVECADFDGDNKPDMAVTALSNYYLTVYRNTGSSFTATGRVDLPMPSAPSQVDAADFDGDGKLDIVVGYPSANMIAVFRNTSSIGNLSFAPRMDIALTGNSFSVVARDFDFDGKADIAFGQQSSSNFSVLRSTGTPGTISFAAQQNFATASTINGITCGDFNNDGKPEIAVAGSNNTVRIYNNTSTVGAVNFSLATTLTTLSSLPYGLVANDFDGDGRHDLAVGYANTNSVSIFEATGSFGFAPRVDIATSASSSLHLNSADFNQDGKPDIVSSSATAVINILTNELDPLASEPTTPATNISVSGQTQTAMTLNFTAGNGFNRIVVAKQGTAITNTPFDGMGYAANSIFGSGTDIGGSTYCVYNGTGNSVTITGLLSNTNYYFAVYEYNSNGSACTNNYLLTSATTNAATLNTPPTLSAIANPSPICQNSGAQLVSLSGIGTGAPGETQTLTVTAVSNNTGLIPNPTVTYLSPNPTGSLSYTPVAGQYGTAVITVTVNDGAANNATTQQTFTVTVTQQPTTSAAGSDQTICVGTATLAANAPAVGTGTWSVFATNNPAITVANLGNVNTPNTTLSGLGSGNIVTLRWTITSGTCTPSFDDVVITRSSCPLTAGFTWSPSTICATPSQINNISFTDASFAPSSTIQTWNWTFAGPITPNPASSTQQNPTNIQFTGPGSFTVTLTITDNAAGNSQVTHTITISPYPAASGVVSGPAGAVCQGQINVPFSVVPIANATSYNWTLPSGASIVSGAGTSSILVNFSNSATSGFVQAQGVNTCGVGAASPPFNVTVNPLPGATASINGPLTVCQGQTGVVFSTTSVPFATSYQWTLPLGATITSSSTGATITVDFAANASGGTVDVIGINSCGNGTSSVGFTITMNPLPDSAGTITGTANVCEGSVNVAYSISSVLNANGYTWTLPPGAVITSGSGTNSILVDYTNVTASGTVTVSGTNTCGSGVSASLPVNVAFLPDSSTAITGATTVCAATSVQYSISAIPGASSYNWTLPPGAVITVDNGNVITVAFSPTAQSGQLTVNGVNACGNGAAGPGIAVTVNPLPDTTLSVSGPVTVCQGDTAVVFSISPVNNATNYGWILPLGATITAGDSTNSITVSFTTSADSGFVMVMGNNGCGFGESADTVQLIVNPLPDAAQAVSGPANIAICPASTGIVFTIPAATNSDYYIWSLPAGATIVSGDSTNTITVDFTSSASSGAVIVAGENGCGQGPSSFLNFAVDEVTPIEICMVTVDTISLYNHVIWEKPVATDIDSFRIYREITSNVFLQVGAVHYDSLSLFVDSIYVPLADPNTTFQRYKIASVDSCGNVSVLSQHHRTLFLQSSLGVGGEVNLSWTLYEGAGVSYYRILRDSTGFGNWEVIDSVPGTNFVYTDQTPPTTVVNCGYKLQTIWLVSCNPTRNINTSESNLEELSLTGINDGTQGVFAVDLYPNPTNGLVTVVYPPADGATFEVRDALGRIVMTKTENSSGGGANSSVTTLDLSEFANGAYTLTITIGGQQVHKKVIIQK